MIVLEVVGVFGGMVCLQRLKRVVPRFSSMTHWFLIFLGTLVISLTGARPFPPYNLQCERNLVGLFPEQLKNIRVRHHFATDNPNPLLSWSIRHSERGAYQRAFRVQVSKGFDLRNIVWDTGVIPSSKQHVMYKGPPLTGGEVYLWNISWWDHRGIPSYSEEIGHFLAVVELDWSNVSWITSDGSISNSYTFTKTVDLSGKQIERAVLYISGLGLYRAYVNGHDLHRLADPPIFFLPGWTNYGKRIGYQAFQVTEQVKENLQTTLMVTLAEGWRNTSTFHVHDSFKDTCSLLDNVERILRVQFIIDFSDGNDPMVIKSDESWEVLTTKYTHCSIFDGEIYNALVAGEVIGHASVTDGPCGVMYLPQIPNIIELDEPDFPIKIYPLGSKKNEQIVDFGVNAAGVLHINVSSVQKFQSIQMKHAEVLLHKPYGEANGSLYTDNLRIARQYDVYTSSGKEQYYQPLFTYHGFRYASVMNYPRTLTPKDVRRVRISSGVKRNSIFNTSDALLNTLQNNVIVGHLSNLMTIQTDCDQRDERLGWMGDAGLSADAMVLNFHLESYLPHRVMIMEDDEFNGSIPEITPFYRFGSRPAESTWAGAFPQSVWVLLKYYGDLKTARDYFPGLLSYYNYMEKSIPYDNITKLNGRNGDWCQPPEFNKVNNNFTSAFSLMESIKQMQEIAMAISDDANSSILSERFSKHAKDFNNGFLTNGNYTDDLQISYALPLYLEITGNNQAYSDICLVNKLAIPSLNGEYHLTAGIVGTKYILYELSALGRNDIAVQTVTTVSYPSYGYMIHNPYEPATALWELWNSHNGSASMDSRNHHMFSSISGWMQTDMIGFQQVKGTFGYQVLDLYPASALDLSAASIQLDYPKPVKYSYHRRGGIQCGKAAEDQSSINPGLPKHDGLVISCGEGMISEVTFASYGNPTGVCRQPRIGSCHSVKSLPFVENECLNKSECKVRTDGDFWGDPCPGEMEVKWLMVVVICKVKGNKNDLEGRYSSLTVDISVPMQSRAQLNIPSYGLSNLQVWDNETLVYSNNKIIPTKGISSAEWVEKDLLRFVLLSGDYSFTVRGHSPNETQISTTNHWENDLAVLKCSLEDNVISRIDWASYGNPMIDEHGSPRMGIYHSEASHMIVEKACVGRRQCSIPMVNKLFFAGTPLEFLPNFDAGGKLVVKYSCNYRSHRMSCLSTGPFKT